MSVHIKNLYHDNRDAGKIIKSTKRYYIWEFDMDNKVHKVEIFHSKLSGKKRLCLDSKIITEVNDHKIDFSYSFKIDNNHFNVIQLGIDKFDMRINNKSFDVLIQEEKTHRLEGKEIMKQMNENTIGYEENEIHYNIPKFSNFEHPEKELKVNNLRNSGGKDFFINYEHFDFNNNKTQSSKDTNTIIISNNNNNSTIKGNINNKGDTRKSTDTSEIIITQNMKPTASKSINQMINEINFVEDLDHNEVRIKIFNHNKKVLDSLQFFFIENEFDKRKKKFIHTGNTRNELVNSIDFITGTTDNKKEYVNSNALKKATNSKVQNMINSITGNLAESLREEYNILK